MVSNAGGSESGRGRSDDWPSRYRDSANEEKVVFMMVQVSEGDTLSRS